MAEALSLLAASRVTASMFFASIGRMLLGGLAIAFVLLLISHAILARIDQGPAVFGRSISSRCRR